MHTFKRTTLILSIIGLLFFSLGGDAENRLQAKTSGEYDAFTVEEEPGVYRTWCPVAANPNGTCVLTPGTKQ